MMKALFSTVLVAVCLCASSVLAGDPRDPEGSLREETKAQSLFAGGPQVSIATLQKENIELKAVIAQLTKRIELLERRLCRVEKGNIRLVSDEIQLPDPSPSLLRFPIEIERGMQFDALTPGRMPSFWRPVR